MKYFAFILLAALVSCSKKAAPAPAVAEQAEPPPAAPAPVRRGPLEPRQPDTPIAAPQRSVAMDEPQLQGTIHPEMTMRLRLFEQTRGRMPQNFYELQNMGGFDSTPGLPPNFMYVIDPKDKTVKIMRK